LIWRYFGKPSKESVELRCNFIRTAATKAVELRQIMLVRVLSAKSANGGDSRLRKCLDRPSGKVQARDGKFGSCREVFSRTHPSSWQRASTLASEPLGFV
jgi:hypothetical protein